MGDMIIFIIFFIICALGYVMMGKIDSSLKKKIKKRLNEDCLSEDEERARWMES